MRSCVPRRFVFLTTLRVYVHSWSDTVSFQFMPCNRYLNTQVAFHCTYVWTEAGAVSPHVDGVRITCLQQGTTGPCPMHMCAYERGLSDKWGPISTQMGPAHKKHFNPDRPSPKNNIKKKCIYYLPPHWSEREMAGKMLERVHSLRRPAQFSGGGEDDAEDAGDESKTRKHMSVVMRATNYLTRTLPGGGCLCPLFLVLSFLLLLFVSSLVIRSRCSVCVGSSAYDPVSRMRFFGYEDPDSDFGSLGVPWCKLSLSLSPRFVDSVVIGLS